MDEIALRQVAHQGFYIIPDKMTSGYLSKFGFSADVIFDIGVSRGSQFLYQLFPKKKHVLIDPLPTFKDIVTGKYGSRYDFDFVECAVGGEAGVAELAIQADDAGKSTLNKPTRIQGQNTSELVSVNVRTLDDISKDYKGRFAVKIDTEGHEVEVLKGATKTLESTEFVLAEVSIKTRFEGGYHFSDVIEIMAENGFEILDVLNPIWRVHLFWDCLFVKRGSPLFSSRAI